MTTSSNFFPMTLIVKQVDKSRKQISVYLTLTSKTYSET